MSLETATELNRFEQLAENIQIIAKTLTEYYVNDSCFTVFDLYSKIGDWDIIKFLKDKKYIFLNKEMSMLTGTNYYYVLSIEDIDNR